MMSIAKRPAPEQEPEPELLSAADALRDDDDIVMRPDGYYWVTVDGKQEVGPFVTLEEARADRHAADEDAPEPGESLQEAESELGIAEWIDPETGDPAEGQSRPHFERE